MLGKGALTVHLLNPVPVVLRQLVVGAQSLIPRIHERTLDRAVRQSQGMTEFMSGHREQTGA